MNCAVVDTLPKGGNGIGTNSVCLPVTITTTAVSEAVNNNNLNTTSSIAPRLARRCNFIRYSSGAILEVGGMLNNKNFIARQFWLCECVVYKLFLIIKCCEKDTYRHL